MRRRTGVLLAALGLALLAGIVGRAADLETFNVVSGIAWLVALVLALTLLPFWSRILPMVPPLPGLFAPPGEGHRWCTGCGATTAQAGPCAACGQAPRERKVKAS